MDNITSKIKVLSLFLIIVFCFSFCITLLSCSESYEKIKTSDDYIRDEIKYSIKGTLYSSGYSMQSFTTNIFRDGNNRYEVSGSVTLKDRYDNIWKGSYDAIVEYDPDSDNYSVRNFDMGNIYKQRW